MSYRKIAPSKGASEWRKRDNDEDEKIRTREKVVDRVSEAYKFVERRELTVRHADDLPLLSGGLYTAQLLQMSKQAESEPDELEDNNKAEGVLKLPANGGIFHDGIPFHHFSLTALGPKHIRRLKKNGIELQQNAFSRREDQQIRENWLSFEQAHQLTEDDAPRMMSAATTIETREGHRERLRFIRASLFRPWMCARLLDRTAAQVFRRCYHLYRVSTVMDNAETTKIWTSAEDNELLALYQRHGPKWEFIGNELFRARYDCRKRYEKLINGMRGENDAEGEESTEKRGGRKGRSSGTETNTEQAEQEGVAGPSDTGTENMPWSQVEIARLYEYLCDHLPRMPVLVALVGPYQNMDSEVNWADPKMRLGGRSAQERKEKWEQLKESFQSARDAFDQSARVKDILRAVLPEDTRILARARVSKRRRKTPLLLPSEHAKWLEKVREFCEEHSLEQPRDIDRKELEQKLKSSDVLSRYSFRAIWRKLRMMLFVGRTAGLFRMLPIEEDKLVVHLRLLVFIFQHIERMSVRKRTLRKYTRRFLRICEWPHRSRVVLVDKAMHGTAEQSWEQMRVEDGRTVVTFKG